MGGRIVFDDQDLIGVEPHNVVERGVVMTPEGRHVFSDMSVMENLQLGAHIRTDVDGVAKDIEGVFKLFPRLQERRKQMAGTLSGGEQQMLAVGRAMMSNPKILMMDEPSLGLAPILVEKIFDIIRKIHDEGKTILLVEQNAHAALEVADYAYILETGRLCWRVRVPNWRVTMRYESHTWESCRAITSASLQEERKAF